jgi:predicted ATPase
LAQELSHPFSLAFALSFAALVHHFRREGQATQERTEALIVFSSEQGFPFWVANGATLRGWALAEQGQGEEGITQMQQGLADWRATGSELQRSHFLALLAEAQGKAEQTEEGLTLLAEALDMVSKTGERFCEAELYRLKGELTLQQFKVKGSTFNVGNPQSTLHNPQLDAEACFLKAIEIARQQSAKSLELRAVMSLSRLWQQQGKKEEAHEMLADIYGWFTEGFDTKDLQEAKALMEELGG